MIAEQGQVEEIEDLVAAPLSVDLKDAQGEKHEPHRGDLCPRCGQARLDYDGLLNLTCPNCGYAVGGCFT
jgi:hypothetical protein